VFHINELMRRQEKAEGGKNAGKFKVGIMAGYR
jgi:hypothetical protein